MTVVLIRKTLITISTHKSITSKPTGAMALVLALCVVAGGIDVTGVSALATLVNVNTADTTSSEAVVASAAVTAECVGTRSMNGAVVLDKTLVDVRTDSTC